VVSLVALGSIHHAVVVALAWFVWCILVLTAWLGTSHGDELEVPFGALGFFTLSLVGLAQLVPLGASLHEVLHPWGWTQFEQSWMAWSGSPLDAGQKRPLSLSPAQTADRVLRWLTLGMFWAASSALTWRSRRHFEPAATALVGVGAFVLALGVAQNLSGTRLYLWFYEATVDYRGFTTFVNTNQAAAFNGLCAMAAVFLAQRNIERKRWRRTAVFLTAFGVFLGGMAIHDSDGVWVVWLVSVSIVVLGEVLSTSRFDTVRARLVARPPLVMGAGAVLLMTSLGASCSRLMSATPEELAVLGPVGVRLSLMHQAIEGMTHSWLTGVGAGAVERVVYPTVDWSYMPLGTIPTIENEWFEWLWTMGVPATALATLMFMMTCRALRPSFDSPLVDKRVWWWAIAVGTYVVGITMLHFPWTMLGLGLPCIFLFDSLLRASWARQRRKSGAWVRLRRAHAVLAGLALTVALLIATFYPHQTPGDADLSRPETWSAERAAVWIVEAPTEGRIFHAAARAHLRDPGQAKDPERLLRFAERAMALEPLPHSYLLLAHALHQAGRDEEAVEHYDWLFAHQKRLGIPRNTVTLLVQDIRAPELMARALRRAQSSTWSVVVHQVREQQGWPGALDLLLEGTEVREDRVAAWSALIRFCMDESQYDLALAWLGLAIEAEEVTPDERVALIGLELEVLTRAKRGALMRQKLSTYMGEHPDDRGLAFRSFRLLGAPSGSGDDVAAGVRRRHEQFCRGVMTPGERNTCAEIRAWLLERDGQIDEAVDVLEQLTSKTGKRQKLVALLVRQRKCVRLRVWAKLNGVVRQTSRDIDRCEARDQGAP